MREVVVLKLPSKNVQPLGRDKFREIAQDVDAIADAYPRVAAIRRGSFFYFYAPPKYDDYLEESLLELVRKHGDVQLRISWVADLPVQSGSWQKPAPERLPEITGVPGSYTDNTDTDTDTDDTDDTDDTGASR